MARTNDLTILNILFFFQPIPLSISENCPSNKTIFKFRPIVDLLNNNWEKSLAKKPTDNFLKKTIEVWQPESPSPLSSEDATAIIKNMAAFIDLLEEWEYSEKSTE